MPTREIPHDEWISFFDEFSRQHEGWLATVEVLGADLGTQVEARELPLVGVTADLKGETEDAVSIFTGAAAADNVTHTVIAPAHVRLEETESGAHQALQIVSRSGETTLIRFRSAVLPEALDGVAIEPLAQTDLRNRFG
jgi:Family of unknown function (DUF5335)